MSGHILLVRFFQGHTHDCPFGGWIGLGEDAIDDATRSRWLEGITDRFAVARYATKEAACAAAESLHTKAREVITATYNKDHWSGDDWGLTYAQPLFVVAAETDLSTAQIVQARVQIRQVREPVTGNPSWVEVWLRMWWPWFLPLLNELDLFLEAILTRTQIAEPTSDLAPQAVERPSGLNPAPSVTTDGRLDGTSELIEELAIDSQEEQESTAENDNPSMTFEKATEAFERLSANSPIKPFKMTVEEFKEAVGCSQGLAYRVLSANDALKGRKKRRGVSPRREVGFTPALEANLGVTDPGPTLKERELDQLLEEARENYVPSPTEDEPPDQDELRRIYSRKRK